MIRSATLGAALATAGLACGYYGVYGGVLLAFAALVFARRDAWYWVALGGAALVAGGLVLPFAVPYERARAATGAEPVRTNPALQISADLQDYLTSPTVVEKAIVPLKWAEPPHESLWPGLVLVALVVIALVGVGSRVVWSYCAVTALVVWASLGPSYGLYAVLMHVVPGMSFLRAPSRLGVAVALGLAVVGGFGARRVIEGRRWALVLLVVACALDCYAGWPGLEAEPIPNVYRVLATLPRGVVVDFPFSYVPNDFHRHTRAMYYSTADWMPRVNGYSDIVPPDFLDIAMPINDFPELSAFPLMRRYQVRYVVWQMEGYTRDRVIFDRLAARFTAAAPYLRPIVRDQDFWLYEIVAWPPEARQDRE